MSTSSLLLAVLNVLSKYASARLKQPNLKRRT